VILNDLDIGGAQNYTISLINEFIKMGHRVSIRVLSDNLLLIHRLSPEVDLQAWRRKYKFDLSVLRKLRHEVKNGSYDGIISSYFLYQKIATFGLYLCPVTLFPVHSTLDRNRKSFLIYTILFRLKRKHEIYITSIDNQTNYLVKSHHLKSDFFFQIYNGILTEKFSEIPQRFSKKNFLDKIGVCSNHKIILMVAGFREEKRHIDAINSFWLLQKEISDVTLICVGDNRVSERNKLQSYIAINGIKNIKLMLSSEAGDVRNYYWSADIFTLTSNKVETFPISVLEALSSGLPCILTDVGGTRDIITDERLGRIVPITNIQEISKAWKEYILNYNADNKVLLCEYIRLNYHIVSSAKHYLNLIRQNNVN